MILEALVDVEAQPFRIAKRKWSEKAAIPTAGMQAYSIYISSSLLPKIVYTLALVNI